MGANTPDRISAIVVLTDGQEAYDLNYAQLFDDPSVGGYRFVARYYGL
jgi:hypothetical protein